MHEAAKLYAEDQAASYELMRAASERFAADATALGDEDLTIEVELAAALTTLIQNHAPQGTLYGEI